MSETIIEVSGLQKSFKGNQVLKDVHFTVEKGSIFALLGSNGAGKTTVVKILATLLKSDDGCAFINGFNVTKQSDDVRKCISLTGQFVAVDETLTGRENLTLIGQLEYRMNIKSKVDEWLSFFNLEDAANRRVSTYSGGMRRRLDIAMSLMGNPQVLFLDEPTTGLDPQNRIAMWDLVKDLAKGGTTVFLTQYSAMNVTADMTKGIIDRFRCMSISKSAVLIGHTGTGLIRGIISTVIIIMTALLLGFRPKAGLIDWFFVILLLFLINITVTLIAILCGMISKSTEGAIGMLFPLFILPFISSGFAPVDTMPIGIRWFAAVQPMTPMIDSLRGLTLGLPVGNSLWFALAWCISISIVSFAVSMRIYNRKLF